MSDPTEPWKLGNDKRPTDAYDTAPAGTRFLMCGYDAHPKEFASGDWVRYTDYEKLKAENDRLRVENAILTDYANRLLRKSAENNPSQSPQN